MKILVDRAKCTGLGICESLAADHFEVDDDGDLVVLKDTVSDQERSVIDEAIAGCPNVALSLSD
jgi:ferredoxin